MRLPFVMVVITQPAVMPIITIVIVVITACCNEGLQLNNTWYYSLEITSIAPPYTFHCPPPSTLLLFTILSRNALHCNPDSK
jgi:hypothetical protein